MTEQAKPFIKWVGGKRQLLQQIEANLPKSLFERDNITYIEPFIGGGAVLLHLLQRYPNIKQAVINDLNAGLIVTYKIIRDRPDELNTLLSQIQNEYNNLTSMDSKKAFFFNIRNRYNEWNKLNG